MIRDDVCELVAESPESHGVFETRTETYRRVFCKIRSIGRYDYWRARDNRLALDLVFILSHFTEYKDERWILYNGEYYKIERTYVDEDGAIELTTRKAEPEYNTAAPVE